MRYWARSPLAFATVVLAAATTVTVPEPRLSATALTMGGTNQVLSIPPKTPEFMRHFVDGVNQSLIEASGLCTGGDPGCALVAVYTPEQLRFITGKDDLTLDESVAVGQANLDACLRGRECLATSEPFTDTNLQRFFDHSFVVEGVSQSAIISTNEKRDLIAHPVGGTAVSFILVASPNRPNGGLFERFVGGYIPLLGVTFNGATQTNSPQANPLLTFDVARQYDGWADFPTNPVNLLADANALLGAFFLHSQPLAVGGASLLQGRYQDSTYYLNPSPLLPLVTPVAAIPLIGLPLALALDPPLRVLVEAGYDRTVNPGQPTPAQWHYATNVVKAAVNFVHAIPTGWDDAIASATSDPANRPFNTEPQGVYGVGGPPVYAGAIDAYGPLPKTGEAVVAQADSRRAARRPVAAGFPPAGHSFAPSLVENRHRAGPPGRSGVNLHRKAGHLEAVGGQ